MNSFGNWCLLAVLALAAVFAFAGCGDDDDDDDNDGGHLVYALDFEGASEAAGAGARVVSDDASAAFVPGLSGNAFVLGRGNTMLAPSVGRVPRHRGTLMFWVLPKTVWHDGRERQILSIGDKNNFSLIKDGAKSKPVFTVSGTGIFPNDPETVVEYYGFDARKPYLWASRWTHVAVTWAGLGERTSRAVRRLYIDGSLVAEAVGTAPDFDTDAPLIVGALEPNGDADGLIDDLRIYDEPWDDARVYQAGFRADVQRRYTLSVVPEPQPYGWKPGEGFTPDAKTVIALPPDQRESLADLVSFVQDALENSFGVRPEAVDSADVDSADNVIAVGTLDNNSAVRAMDRLRYLPASVDQMGAGGYLLDIDAGGIAVAGADDAGIRYGLTSLLRIVNQKPGEALPPVLLADRPDFHIRGTVVPGLFPLTDQSRRAIRYLGELKLTHLLIPGDFYFDLGNTVVREQARELFAFVRSQGMEPVPQLAWYGGATRVIAECASLGIDCAEGAGDDTCPLIPELYEDILIPMLAHIRDDLAPAAIDIGHEDIRRFNENPVCAAAGKAPVELYAYSVTEVVRTVRAMMPDTRILISADMIASMGHGYRLLEPAPGSEETPPSVYDLIPKEEDVTWCASVVNNSALLDYVYAFSTFAEFEQNGIASYVGGPGGKSVSQAFMWIKNADDFGAPGFIGRPPAGTPADFADPLWLWLPATEELAWTLWSPDMVQDQGYTFEDLNAAYGSF